MRRQFTVYVSDEEYGQLAVAARQLEISLSRYAKERLLQPAGDRAPEIASLVDAVWAASEKRIDGSVRGAVMRALKPVSDVLNLLTAMVDQFALSVLIHTPEIPEEQKKQAITAGIRRHKGWRAEVEDVLKQVSNGAGASNGVTNGAHA